MEKFIPPFEAPNLEPEIENASEFDATALKRMVRENMEEMSPESRTEILEMIAGRMAFLQKKHPNYLSFQGYHLLASIRSAEPIPASAKLGDFPDKDDSVEDFLKKLFNPVAASASSS